MRFHPARVCKVGTRKAGLAVSNDLHDTKSGFILDDLGTCCLDCIVKNLFDLNRALEYRHTLFSTDFEYISYLLRVS